MKKFQIKKVAMALVVMMLGFQVFAQGRIGLNAAKSAQTCVNADKAGLSASFSFSAINADEVSTEKGMFSNITMDGTFPSGEVGEPTIPVANKLIAVPFGANDVTVNVKSYTTEEYKLADYGIHQVYPQQPILFKNQKPEDVPFEYNAKAYTQRGYMESPIAEVAILGQIRGIQVASLTVRPVQYDAANNTIRVYNNIEVEVSYGKYNEEAAYNEFARTFSPYFAGVYNKMFNNRAIKDVYDDHPDLWQNPVKMLVVANRMFETTLQEWVNWKTEKGFYVDVNYTDQIGTNAAAIKTFIQQKYAADAPTFLMIVGDKTQVPESATGSQTSCVTDLSYSSVDGDQFPDMFHSRLSATSTSELQAMLNKSLEYEQLTMPDPSYLSKVLLIAGEDSGWGITVGRPTIWYATNYYYNAEHGYTNVYEYSHGTYTGCYSNLNTGVGFANYTAHGSQTSWADPSFTVSNVNSLTNEHKYFLAIGNCCQSGDWGYGTCFGEAMVRAANKGAYAYIGSCPNTTWLNDYYFGVGATNHANGTMPTYEETTLGIYDAMWTDDEWNTVCAVLYVGCLAGNEAQSLGYTMHSATLYYWQAYHVLGDGSVLPYRVAPGQNTVSHMPTLPIGMDYYTVTAAPGSYVGISKDGVLYGAGMVDETGTTDIAIEPITSSGNVKIVVTHPQYAPYIAEVPAAAMTGPYVAVDSYTPGNVPCNEQQTMSMTFKNVGASATSGTTNVVLSCENENLTIIDGTGSFGVLNTNETVTLNNEFSFVVANGVSDNTRIQIDVTATCGSDSWTGKANIIVGTPIIEFTNMQWSGSFAPGETSVVAANFRNIGHYKATNASVTVTSTSSYVTIASPTVTLGTIGVNGEVTAVFDIAIDASCPSTEAINLVFALTADNEVEAAGSGVMKNSCNVVFELSDSYGDGWNGASLRVAFNDGTPQQTLTVASGQSSATYTIEIGSGVHVTLTWTSGSWDSECSFVVRYEGGAQITSASDPASNYNFQFAVACGGEPVTMAPVQNLAAAVEGNVVTLTWAAPASGTPTGYIVKRDGVQIDEVTGLTYVDENLEWGTTYSYAIIAKYSAGNSLPQAVNATTMESVGEYEANFGVYPNPAENVLNISTDANKYEYQLVNGLGQIVIRGTANGNETINVSDLNGMYFLRIIADGNVIVRKVIIK